MSDAYRAITVVLRSIQPNVLVVEKPKARGDGLCTIARSLIHFADDRKTDAMPRGQINVEFTMRVREWKAEQLGFAG